MKNNIGEAILILGLIAVIITQHLKWYSWIAIVFLFLLTIATWEFISGKEVKEYYKKLKEKTGLEIQLMKAQTQWYVAQGAMIMKQLGRT